MAAQAPAPLTPTHTGTGARVSGAGLSPLPPRCLPLPPAHHAGSEATTATCFPNLTVSGVLALSVFIPCNIHHAGLFMGPLFGKVFFRAGE